MKIPSIVQYIEMFSIFFQMFNPNPWAPINNDRPIIRTKNTSSWEKKCNLQFILLHKQNM